MGIFRRVRDWFGGRGPITRGVPARSPVFPRRVSPVVQQVRNFVAAQLQQKGVIPAAFPALLEQYRGDLSAAVANLRGPKVTQLLSTTLEQDITRALAYYREDSGRIASSTPQDFAMLYLLTEALEKVSLLPRVFIPGGEVLLGSPDSDTEAGADEKPQVLVRVSSFEAARNLLSVGDVDYYNAESGDLIEIPKFEKIPKLNQNSDDPIAGLTQMEARKIAQWYGGDLPTEAQYEYVAKGRTGKDRYGTPIDKAITWESWGERNQSTAPICAEDDHSRENNFGVCDVAGNLWKWTQEQYAADRYKNIPAGALDPVLPFAGFGKVSERGGSWDNGRRYARAANRDHDRSAQRDGDVGVWVVWSCPRT